MLLAASRPLDIHGSGKKPMIEWLLALDCEIIGKHASTDPNSRSLKFLQACTHFHQRIKVLVPCLRPLEGGLGTCERQVQRPEPRPSEVGMPSEPCCPSTRPVL